MTAAPAATPREATRSPRAAQLVAAVPLLTVFAWLALVYAWQAWLVTTPVIFTDELLYTELARSLADTGHATLRGEPHSIGSLAVAARAPAWLLGNLDDAYLAAKLIGVVAMTTAAFPAYALTRLLAGRRAALFAAVGTVTVPALSYSALLLEEPIAYPVATAAFFLGVLALARPTRATIGGAVAVALLAPLVRRELVLVPLTLALAALAVAWTSARARRIRGRWRPWDAVALVVVAAGVAVLAYEVLHSRSVEWRIATDRPREMLDEAVAAAGALAIGVGILPVVAALAVLVRPAGAPRSSERRAFVAVFAAATPAFLLYAGAKGAWLATVLDPRVLERNLIYLAPLIFAATAMWLERPRARPLAAVAAAAAVLVLLVSPRLDFGHPYFEAPGYAITSLANRELFLSDTTIERLLLIVAVGSAATVLLARRYPQVVLAAAAIVLAWNATGEVYASLGLRDFSERIETYVRQPVGWVDGATGGDPALFLGLGLDDPNRLYTLEFWNRSISAVWTLDRSVLAPGPTGFPNVDATTGRILPDPGTRYVVADSRVALAGRRIAGAGRFVLYRVAQPLRLRDAVAGVYADGWMGTYSTYDRYWTRSEGDVEVTVGRLGWRGTDVPAPAVVRVGRLTTNSAGLPSLAEATAERRWIVHSGQQRVFRLRAPKPPFRVEVGVARTFVPAELDPRATDQRSLGAQVRFRFVPSGAP